MKDVLIVIPARIASTRFPNKVLARLDGKTIIEWCWSAATKAQIGPVIIATDSELVSNEVQKFGGIVKLTSTNCPSGSDRVWEVARNRKEDVILNIQGDMPFIRPETIRSTVKSLNSMADVATAVIPLTQDERLTDPNVVKVALTPNNQCLYFSRSVIPYNRSSNQNVRYWEHLGLYAYHRKALKKFISLPPSPLEKSESLEQLRALEAGMKIFACSVNELPLAIDVPADLKRAENTLAQGIL